MKFKIRTVRSLQQCCSPSYVSVGILLTVENTCTKPEKNGHTCVQSVWICPQFPTDRIDGVMVGVLASSSLDRGFESRSGQTKDNKIGTCCFSAKLAALWRKNKDWLVSEATCVSANCCFSVLAL